MSMEILPVIFIMVDFSVKVTALFSSVILPTTTDSIP